MVVCSGSNSIYKSSEPLKTLVVMLVMTLVVGKNGVSWSWKWKSVDNSELYKH